MPPRLMEQIISWKLFLILTHFPGWQTYCDRICVLFWECIVCRLAYKKILKSICRVLLLLAAAEINILFFSKIWCKYVRLWQISCWVELKIFIALKNNNNKCAFWCRKFCKVYSDKKCNRLHWRFINLITWKSDTHGIKFVSAEIYLFFSDCGLALYIPSDYVLALKIVFLL